MEQRIVKVPLPVTQIRRMDELLSARAGGFETRSEFIHEAIENLILELTFEDAPPQGLSTPETAHSGDGSAHVGFEETPAIEATVLQPPELGFMHDGGFENEDTGLLFGLHNRDYPSVWGLVQLADLTREAAISFGEFIDETVQRAWTHGRLLQALEAAGGRVKLSTLFPTNPDKPIAAGDRFRLFGLGDYLEREGQIVTMGPLFAWRVAALFEADGGLLVAPTPSGYRLANDLKGLAADWPHSRRHAEAFLSYLRRKAPGDFAGFATALKTIEAGGSREHLLDAFSRNWPELGESEVSVDAQAYVARCREWGLVEPKQIRRKYALTEYGTEYLTELSGGNHVD